MPNSLTAEISSGKGSRDSSPSTNPSSNLGALKPKASTNVFSSDGSFLERFLTSKKEEDEKKKQEEAVARKRDFDTRFKKRGKRSQPDTSSSNIASEVPSSKKSKSDKPMTEYQKEVKAYAGHSLKDNGTGVHSLVK